MNYPFNHANQIDELRSQRTVCPNIPAGSSAVLHHTAASVDNLLLLTWRPLPIYSREPAVSSSQNLALVRDGAAGTKPQFTTQNFRDAPSLSNTAASREWRFGIEDLADGTDPAFTHFRIKACE
jgi:hypothetical protein